MTLESFKTLVVSEAIILHLFGQESSLEDVIYAVPEWHRQWADALRGFYDA